MSSLTVNEVADELRVSTQTVRNLCRSGEIEYIKIGRVIRIEGDSLQNFYARKRAEAKSRAEEARL